MELAVKDTADSGSEITWKDGNEPFHVIIVEKTAAVSAAMSRSPL